MTGIQTPRDFSSVNRRERMALQSRGLPTRPAEERVNDFDEPYLPLSAELASHEAMRCIHCPDPAPCYKACPTRNDISLTMWLIEQGQFLEAARAYRQSSSMPEICGRVCPHDKLCEGACVRGNKGGIPVPCGALEAFVADYERQQAGIQLKVPPSTGHKVAIVGGGPAGLACAHELVQRGHWVTIFDSKPFPGGLLTYGIPNFKLPKEMVINLWRDLRQAGVTFVGNTYIGKTRSVDDLYKEGFEAIFIGTGVTVDTPLGAPGEDLPGVYKATEFLVRANVELDLLPAELRARPQIGSKIVVVGGGDTASDCLRTAVRMGCPEVTCLYRRTENEMPGRGKDRKLAMEEGAKYQFLTQPIRLIAGENGRVAQVECIRMELGEPDAKGRRKPVPVRDSNFIVEADTVILALGYQPDSKIIATTPGLGSHKWGLVIADPATGATSRFGLYAGGDVVSGPDLVVTAMVAGRKAALTIDAYLE